MKSCSKCRVEKSLSDFGKATRRKDGKHVYCRECIRIMGIASRKKHNEKRTEYNKQYRAENREKYNAWERDYFEKNREKLNAKSKEWREGEQGKFLMMHLCARGRARKKNLPYELTPGTIRILCEITQSGRCALTGIEFDYSKDEKYKNRPFAPSIDRIDSKKGYTLDNVQITCVMVNKAKNEFPQEMFDTMCLARMRQINAKI